MALAEPVASRTKFTRFALPGACHIASTNVTISLFNQQYKGC